MTTDQHLERVSLAQDVPPSCPNCDTAKAGIHCQSCGWRKGDVLLPIDPWEERMLRDARTRQA